MKKVSLVFLFIIFAFVNFTFALNTKLVASHFVDKILSKYQDYDCKIKLDKTNSWIQKIDKIKTYYSKNTKITIRQRLMILQLLWDIKQEFETKSVQLAFECKYQIDKKDSVSNTWNIVESSNKNLSWNYTKLQRDVLEETNKQRAKYKLPLLTMNSKLTKSAQWYANYLCEVNKWLDWDDKNFWFSHYSKDWKSPFDRIKEAWYNIHYAGENLAYWFWTWADWVVKAWMWSPWHRENILNWNFRELWVGICEHFWVQNFGTEYK